MTNQIKNQKSEIINVLGEPLPASKHAVSVSLPKWADVVGYEEGDARVISAMKTGYPRFVYNAVTKKLFAAAEKEFARENEFCLTFPSERIAKLCVSCALRQYNEQHDTILNHQPAINQFSENIWAVTFPENFRQIAKSFWQHAGFIISSRQAEAALTPKPKTQNPTPAKAKIRAHLATLTGETTDNIYLFPSGMSAIFTAFEITTNENNKNLGAPPSPPTNLISVGRARVLQTQNTQSEQARRLVDNNDLRGATIQLGFPYVDTLKIQQKFGSETIFLPDINDLDQLEKIIKEKNISAVFTEFPTNPLITCVDLERLSNICRANKVALVIDDTLSTWANASTISYADITVSSLTKFFSGIGDVLAGSLILNSKSPSYKLLKSRLDAIYEDVLFSEDAVVLEKNSRDFAQRIAKINETAESLYEFLNSHPALTNSHPALDAGSLPPTPQASKDPASSAGCSAAVYYPKGNKTYEKYKTGGYGGIISIVLPTEEQAIKFFDALEINKGPSLGTNYTLACPYTLLAHYHERDFAENSGVPFHLIRVSVGLEPIDELKSKFSQALKLATKA